jgi:hypothetical protein
MRTFPGYPSELARRARMSSVPPYRAGIQTNLRAEFMWNELHCFRLIKRGCWVCPQRAADVFDSWHFRSRRSLVMNFQHRDGKARILTTVPLFPGEMGWKMTRP